MVSEEFIREQYPLHWLVWNNEYKLLEKALSQGRYEIEKCDNRGRTPLMLAVTLGHLESTRTLLNNQASITCRNADGWTIVQEAVATGDPEILLLVLERREVHRYLNRMGGIPDLLKRLKDAPDFYVEMKWEFTSWLPLVSRLCPSDVYKIYKQGSQVRIDTTLLGFNSYNNSWERGNKTYIFKGDDGGTSMMEIDHDEKQYLYDEMKTEEQYLGIVLPNEETVSQRLTNPIVTTYIDIEKISFERNKAGIWGWRSDKNELVNGRDCKVFSATNVEVVTKTRTEHLTERDKVRMKSARSPLQNLLGIAEVAPSQASNTELAADEEYVKNTNPCNITPEEYFDASVDLNERDIGRPKEVSVKLQKFKAHLWLCEDYPLSLPEQILPIIDLMSLSSPHFAKLKDFIQLQLPSGFPVKIEIPIFHILNARITFGNIFALDSPVPHVTTIQEEDRLACVVDESLFNRPPGYHMQDRAETRRYGNEDDELLQFAIRQSLVEAGPDQEEIDVWEALRWSRTAPRADSPVQYEETELQRAIQASLEQYQDDLPIMGQENGPAPQDLDYDFQMALMVSKNETEKEQQNRVDEEKLLEQVLELSLTEK